jgi:hypothetical protein
MEVGQLVRIKEGAFGNSPSPLEQSYIGQEGYLRNKDFQGVAGQWLVLVNTALLVMTEKDLEPVEERAKYGFVNAGHGYSSGERVVHWQPNSWPTPDELENFSVATVGQIPETEQYVFLVILPDNNRRHIQAAYMEVDGGSLYFGDDNRETILAFGPGHWVWAERVEDESQNPT